MNINRYQAAKNLQPARSLRTPNLNPNRNALGDFGYPPHLVEPYHQSRAGGGSRLSNGAEGGQQHHPRSSSQSRRHDVLRTPSLTRGGRSNTPTSGSGLTFNATTLTVGLLYEVYVSYVQNGPKQFMVQLRSTEMTLKQMMTALARVPLRPINRKLQLGMACLARYSKNMIVYRGLITALRRDGTCTVSYVDYGHSESVHPSGLYEIPPEFMQYQIFSTRFTLSNVRRLEDINADVAGIFSRMVSGRGLTLKVMPPEGAAFVSYCELYDSEGNIFNRLVGLCRTHLYKYPAPESLPRGGSYHVVIRFIQSCAQFFVHMLDSVATFDKMMDDLSAHCRDSVVPGLVQVGDAFAVSFGPVDFYRAEVVEIGPNLTVRLVDYGNCIPVERSQLRRLSPDFVHQRPESYECCLEGFEGSITDELSTKQLDMLAECTNRERNTFKLIVCDVRDGKMLVNLFDESKTPVLNVSKTLLKLNNPVKFIKEQQSNQQKMQSKLPGSGGKTNEGGRQSAAPAASGWNQNQQVATSNSNHKQIMGTSTESVKNQLSSSGVSSNNDYIDLTSEEWTAGTPLPAHQSSGYEQLAAEGGGLGNTQASPQHGHRSGYGRESNHSSRDSSSSNSKQENKRTSVGSPAATSAAPRNDIPRFNKERNPTPYYYEHDDRCSEPTTATAATVNERNGAGELRSPGNAPEQANLHARLPTTEKPKSPSTVTAGLSDDYVPYQSSFPVQVVPLNTKQEVVLSWWYSPEQFFVRLRTDDDQYHEMMKQLQKFYRNKSNQQQHHQLQQQQQVAGGKASKPTTGSIVVVRHPKHNAFYRGRVLKYNEAVQKYKVELVDGGNKLVLSVNELWMVERRFTRLAPMAISCSLPDIRLLCDVKELQGRIDTYIVNDKQIEIVFLESVEGKYLCKVDSQGHDLRSKLIGDSLIAQVLVDIDLSRLKGQTLKVQLIELQDLTNFRVRLLGHDATFSCRQDGCDAFIDPVEILGELRNKWLDRYCLAQVVDVASDEKLVLSLLIPRLTGQPAPTIAEMPVLVGTFDVYVTHVEGTNCVYVQNVRWATEITQLMDQLFEYYENQREAVPMVNLTMNEMCASKSALDGSWYRAKIVSLQEIDKIEVLLVDYGLREQVKHSELRLLEPQFLEYGAFAHKVYLPMGAIAGVDEQLIETEVTQLTDGHELTLNVNDFRNSIWIVDITSNGHSIVSVLKDKQLVADLDYEMIFNQRQASTPIPGAVVRPSVEDHEAKHQKIRAKICHVDNPSQLFIQLESDLKDLHQLQETLQIIASSLPPLRDFSADRHCIAQYSADDLWYRALIIDSHDDLIIQFVDFGHTDIVTSNKKSTLKDINDDLMRWKIYAKQCAMLVQPTAPDHGGAGGQPGGVGRKKPAAWKEVATTILRARDEVDVQFLAEAQGVHYISVRSGEKDLAEMLVEKKLAVRLLYVPTGQMCFTSHIESINEFYLQLERDIFPLDTMSNYLSDVSKFADVSDPHVGLVCIAEFVDDEQWYRAKVLTVLGPNEYEVFFLDYGNTSVVHKLKQLDASIAELARLCTKCALRLPENVKSWSRAADLKFLELAATGQTVFTVQLHSPGPSFASVELFLEGRNIAEQLVALCEKGTSASAIADVMSSSFYLMGDDNRLDDSYQLEDDKVHVSHVNSPAEFFIQFKNSFDALRNMEELLAAKAGQCEVIPDGDIQNGLFCLAQLAKGGKFCRALVLSEVHGGHAIVHQVLLVDYGNRAAATELRRMPPGIEEMSRLAKKCCLEHYLPTDEHALGSKRWARIRGRFTELTDVGREVFSVEIVRNDCDPMIIRLFTPARENVEDLIRDDAIEQEDGEETFSTTANSSSDVVDTQIRAKPKQAFYRSNSDLDFLEN